LESLAEEASEGRLTPSQELEDALREAAEAVEARAAERGGAAGAAAGASTAELEALRAELETARGRLAETEDRLLRLAADFENFRRRTLKEREEAHAYGHQNVVKDMLSSVDNLERAIAHARQSGGGDFEGLLQGIDLVLRELLNTLAKHGVSEVDAQGQPFDPSVHEAIAQVPDDTVPPNTVLQVFQRGYRLRDRLLRPAQVVVSRSAGTAGAAET
jgi:molecular chaperone GrpE